MLKKSREFLRVLKELSGQENRQLPIFLTVYTLPVWPMPISSHCRPLVSSSERSLIPVVTSIDPSQNGLGQGFGSYPSTMLAAWLQRLLIWHGRNCDLPDSTTSGNQTWHPFYARRNCFICDTKLRCWIHHHVIEWYMKLSSPDSTMRSRYFVNITELI